MEWNKDEWQGRSREQVERNYKTFGLFIKVILITITIMLLVTLFSCKQTEKIDCDAYSKLEKND